MSLHKIFHSHTPSAGRADHTRLHQIAMDIEEQIWRQFQSGERLHDAPPVAAYRSRSRFLLEHLRDPDHPQLCESLLEGALSPEEFVALKDEELASPAVKEARARNKEAVKAEYMLGEAQPTMTRDYVCSQCGSNDTGFVVLSVRRDLGKAETWGSKDSDASIIRITCMQCSHQWSAELL